MNAQAREANGRGSQAMDKITVGDIVRLIGLPDWLIEDLPADKQNEIRSFVGKTAAVTKIDENGYFGLGFGIYSDHSKTHKSFEEKRCPINDVHWSADKKPWPLAIVKNDTDPSIYQGHSFGVPKEFLKRQDTNG